MLDDLIDSCDADGEAFFAMLRSNSPEDSGWSKLRPIPLVSRTISFQAWGSRVFHQPLRRPSQPCCRVLCKGIWENLRENRRRSDGAQVRIILVQSGRVTTAFKECRYDLAELALGPAGGALGAAPLTVAASGVWLMGLADEGIRDIFNKGYGSPAEHAYQLFTWEYVSYSPSAGKFGCRLPNDMPARALLAEEMVDAVIVNEGNTWASLLKREFVKHRNNPQKMFDAIEALLDDYAAHSEAETQCAQDDRRGYSQGRCLE